MRWLSVVAALAAAAAVPALPAPEPDGPDGRSHVQVLSFNDFHGALEPPAGTGGEADGTPAGGAAYLATHLKQLRRGHGRTITVGAGDLIGGSPIESARYHDEPTVDALDAMDLRVTAMGNHELDDGVDELLTLQRRARFRWLAANTLRGGAPLLPAFAIEDVGGYRIGFVGVTLRETPFGVAPGGTDGLQFADEADTANRYAGELKRIGADAVFVLLHQGGATSSDSPNGCSGFSGPVVDITKRFSDDVDAVASAHTHGTYNCEVDGTPVVSAASNGRLVTDWDLAFEGRRLVSVTPDNVVVTRDVAPDPEVGRIVADARRRVAPLADRVVGRLEDGIDRERLATVIADADLEATREQGADIGLMNRAGIRTDLAAGEVTYGDAFGVLPFSHDVVVRAYSGVQLRAALSQQYDPEAGGADLGRSSNLDYDRDGDRVTTVRIDGRTVDDEDEVQVAMNRFLAEGGDGFTALERGTLPVEGPVDVDALAAHLGRRAAG